MSGGIYLIQGDDDLVEMREQAYDSEDLLQALLARYPALLAGDQLATTPRRWLLIGREQSLPSQVGGGGRWSVDHLFLDQDAVPTIVEVKRSSDTRIRREVVGQMLDYAANAVVYWPVERLRASYEASCQLAGVDPAEQISERLGIDPDADGFWATTETNLQAGKVRLVFVADEIPPELRRIIEFLNEQMNPAEVIGIEIRQYAGSGLRTLVPRVVGQTAEAQARKRRTSTSQSWDWNAYETDLSPASFSVARSLFVAIADAVGARGLAWTPVFRRSYIAFQRAGGYNVVVVELFRGGPPRLAVKMPEAPVRLGLENPYPELANGWDAQNKQWNWVIPSADDIPDVGAAIEITARYQPPGGPMIAPTSGS
jgi:hypothetical protein